MERSKTCMLVGSDKGGVGKSLISQILVAAYDQAGRQLGVIEIDNQHTLSSVFGERVDLSLDATPPKTDGKRESIDDHYARPYALWAQSDCVTDLGANVTTPLLSWMQEKDIVGLAQDDDVHFMFLTIAIPDDQSLKSATSSIELARRALGVDAKLYIILNDTAGLEGFTPYQESPTWERLMAVIDSHDVEVIRIPHCGSKLMDWGRANGLTVLQILANGDQVSEICERAGFNKLQRKIEIQSFVKWVREVQDAMTPIFTNRHGKYSTAAE